MIKYRKEEKFWLWTFSIQNHYKCIELQNHRFVGRSFSLINTEAEAEGNFNKRKDSNVV